MLLRFGVKNYRSIREYQELLLTASSLKDTATDLISVPRYALNVLPSVAIYGANASGKSSVLKAFAAMKKRIVKSFDTTEATTDRQPFLLGGTAKGEPTRFDCDFILPEGRAGDSGLGGIRFHYGFEFNDEEIIEEWLYAYPKKQKQVWFHRTLNNDFQFGKQLKGQNKAIAQLTRKDSLFLSAAERSNHQQLSAIVLYFTKHFNTRQDEFTEIFSPLMALYLQGGEFQNRILGILKNADVGICSATVSVKDESNRPLLEELRDGLKGDMSSLTPTFLNDVNKKIEVRLGHTTEQGEVFLPVKEESQGTIILLNLAGFLCISLALGETFIVDEFDASLHPLICRKIVELFNSKETNPNGAQMIFTTHDTNLLNLDLMRRDQIWFTEKNPSGETQLYPLTNIQVRATGQYRARLFAR